MDGGVILESGNTDTEMRAAAQSTTVHKTYDIHRHGYTIYILLLRDTVAFSILLKWFRYLRIYWKVMNMRSV